MTKRKKIDPLVTVTVPRQALWDAHTWMYTRRDSEFPNGHYGGGYCPCPIARALRAAEEREERPEEEVAAHIAAVNADRLGGMPAQEARE